MEGSGKQAILNRCSLILIPIGGQLFLQSRWTRVIRFLMSVWVISVMPFFLYRAWGNWMTGSLKMAFLMNASFVIGINCAHGLLIWKRSRMEKMISRLARGRHDR